MHASLYKAEGGRFALQQLAHKPFLHCYCYNLYSARRLSRITGLRGPIMATKERYVLRKKALWPRECDILPLSTSPILRWAETSLFKFTKR